MADRLADVTARLEGIRQLGTVVNAMRGIAAARAQQARGQLAAVDFYAATIAAAIGQALALVPADQAGVRRPVRPALVLFCAEQGFAGAFSERVLDAAGADLGTTELFLVGTRGGMVAAERRLGTVWRGAMPAHVPGVPKFADRLAGALYSRIAAGVDRLDVLFSRWQPGRGLSVVRSCLFPCDLTAFPVPAGAGPPLAHLATEPLLRALTADYLHARLCHAALHAFVAENEARMETMAAARRQIDRTLTGLQATQRRVRQDEITAEIIELAAGESAIAESGRGRMRESRGQSKGESASRAGMADHDHPEWFQNQMSFENRDASTENQ